MNKVLPGAGLFLFLFLVSCSSTNDPVIASYPDADTPCEELGQQSCSLLEGGSWVVLRCTLDSDGELFWRSMMTCEVNCKNGSCLGRDGDVVAVDVKSGDSTDELSDSDVVTGDSTDLESEETGSDEDQGCLPQCDGKVCGPDGCGGECGECPKDHVCVEDQSSCCKSDCKGKLCGDDGCGGSCGECPEGSECNAYNQCAPPCEPDCDGKECGPDGCDGTCGECPEGKACGPQGKCNVCLPLCEGKECGDDGCGGSCGACPYGHECENHECQEPCAPNCAGKDCGDDGCGDSCGDCLPGETCVNQKCLIVCTPDCGGKECGSDGCGGSCGKCPAWAWCSAQGLCVADCEEPDCEGKICGPDGCGGSCGTCPEDQACTGDGQCVEESQPCGGVTEEGHCDENVLVQCLDGKLVITDCKEVGKNLICEWLEAVGTYGCFEQGECVPDCTGLECGSDGCGGSCGSCQAGQQCINGQCLGQGPCGDIGFQGCCQDNVALWCDSGVLWYMDCSTMLQPDNQVCGWNEELGFYDCIHEALEGPEQYPYNCEGACVPTCAFKQCGDDGCGGSCGDCPPGTECLDKICQGSENDCGGYSDEPVCQGDTVVWCEEGQVFFQDCADMGELFHCGWVPGIYNYGCYEGECVPDCEGKQCGDDGCGYVCGYCPITKYCNDKFQCVFGQGMCGDIDYTGVCDGNVVKWCQNGILQQFDCNSLGPTWQCGWFEEGGYYWCLE